MSMFLLYVAGQDSTLSNMRFSYSYMCVADWQDFDILNTPENELPRLSVWHSQFQDVVYGVYANVAYLTLYNLVFTSGEYGPAPVYC